MRKFISPLFIFSVLFLFACNNDDKTAPTNDVDKMAESDSSSKIEQYFKTHDTTFIAEDAVFKNMSTGEDVKGRKAVGEMLNHIYHVAFDAKADVKHTIVTDKNAVLEATFTGKHIGEFANVPATNKEVNVPLCVTYDLDEKGLIKEARIYMLVSVMMQQLQGK